MKVVVVHLGSVSECFTASSINHALAKRYPKLQLLWVVKDQECKDLFRYSSFEVKTLSNVAPTHCDVLINLHPDYAADDGWLSYDCAYGFNMANDCEQYFEILYGKKKSSKNIFQVYHRLAGLVWKGKGYDVSYYPKTKSKKDRAGIAIANANLRDYVVDKLEVTVMKPWVIPRKKKVFKRMDEINKCSHVITDDFFSMHLSIYLRKYVHFLHTFDPNVQPEFFNKGQVYSVPLNIISRYG